MKKTHLALFALLCLYLPLAVAANPQNHAEIRDTVLAFVRAQTQGLPGKVSIQVENIDKRIVLPACPALEAFLPQGAQLNGNSSVGVRCNNNRGGWSVFVPVTVRISIGLLITNKTLLQGQAVRAEDLGSLSSETLQPDTLTDPVQAIGKIMKFGVGKGQLLRQNMLRDPYTVIQGQAVQLLTGGRGFQIRSEGLALNNAAEGQPASARTSSGQKVSGVVKGGMIEIQQ
jgi:flagellar basal body P-ring formation protein FlgA